MAHAAGAVAAAAFLVLVSGAAAKEFEPGDVSVCNAARCVAIVRPEAMPPLEWFYYMGPQPAVVRGPALRTPYYELRFENGYVTGIVATRRLDRFLSYGVILERFKRGRWYGMPAELSAELRTLTASMRPYRLTRRALDKSR